MVVTASKLAATASARSGAMSQLPAALAPLLSRLPEDRVGTIERIEPLTMGLSGAGVYAVPATRGAIV